VSELLTTCGNGLALSTRAPSDWDALLVPVKRNGGFAMLFWWSAVGVRAFRRIMALVYSLLPRISAKLFVRSGFEAIDHAAEAV